MVHAWKRDNRGTTSATEDVPAFTYVVTRKYELPFDQPVSLDYRHLIMAGAHQLGFSESYCRYLEKKLVAFVKHKKIRLMPG
jgi:hypothetical protein